MAGGRKAALIKLADSNKKGKEFVKEVNDYLSPESILKYRGNEKYPVAQKNKKPVKKYGC